MGIQYYQLWMSMVSCISNNNVCMHHGAPRGESGWVVKAKRARESNTRTHALHAQRESSCMKGEIVTEAKQRCGRVWMKVPLMLDMPFFAPFPSFLTAFPPTKPFNLFFLSLSSPRPSSHLSFFSLTTFDH